MAKTRQTFDFVDDELNELIISIVHDPSVTCLITLDKSQAGGVYEKSLLDSDATRDPMGYNSHFVIDQSATHPISDTKRLVVDGKVGGEGSTNWSISGEGIIVVKRQSGGLGDKAQNNTQTPDVVTRFQAELLAEHVAAQRNNLKGAVHAKAA